MKTVCLADQCTGCRACEVKCPRSAIRLVDTLDRIFAEISEDQCIHCGLCEQVCPNHTIVEKREPIEWHQGWTNNVEMRKTSSSGGLAAELTKRFIENGGYVCSCYFDKGNFDFHITNNSEEARRFSGSKYVKTNPFAAYKNVDEFLKKGEKVLFIGLPCQVAAIKNYIPQNRQGELYCIDLICHGTPSVDLLKIFLAQHGVEIATLDEIRFRTKGRMGLSVKSVFTEGVVDRYLISFLNALNYTEGCYNCEYACKSRVSDITLGDNWGTELSGELSKGLSLVLCVTEKGRKLLEDVDANLVEVNIEKAIEENGQLIRPSAKPAQREEFFKEIKSGANYDRLVLKIFPKQSARQILKEIAIKMNLYKCSGRDTV